MTNADLWNSRDRLHRELTMAGWRKNLSIFQGSWENDGGVKQTSPLQVPLKRIYFKSNERFRKLSNEQI